MGHVAGIALATGVGAFASLVRLARDRTGASNAALQAGQTDDIVAD